MKIKKIRHNIKVVLDILVDCIHRLIYYITPKKNGINTTENRDKKIIVSLTSIPSRIKTLNLCIESLLRQTMKPDKIILYLDNVSEKVELPRKLLDQTKRGLTIEYCDKIDLRSHTKYFYVMQEFPNDIIITVDDDVYYNKNTIKQLWESYKKHPNCVSCIKMHEIKFKGKEIMPYNSWKMNIYGKETTSPNKNYMAIGAGGILYPPKAIDKEAFNKEEIKEKCLKADDIWLKYMELKNEVKVVRAIEKKCYIHNITNTQKEALFKDNLINSENDIYIKNLLSKYM